VVGACVLRPRVEGLSSGKAKAALSSLREVG
jgi:hypothetical protein